MEKLQVKTWVAWLLLCGVALVAGLAGASPTLPDGDGTLLLAGLGIFGKIGKSLVGLIPGGRTVLDIAGLGLSAFGAVQGAKAQGRQSALAQEAADLARQDYESRLPIREQALASLNEDFARPDLGGVFGASQSSNPFASGFSAQGQIGPPPVGPVVTPDTLPPPPPVARRRERGRRRGGGAVRDKIGALA